jgi:DNA-binding response OmpR family regulator
MKILIADDSGFVRKTLEFSLKDTNHKITVAIDGKDALEKIKLETPDLIITDIMMPFISGLELVKWVKENYADPIKIIILTSLGQEDVVLEAFSLGIDDFLTKPFNSTDLLLRVKRFEN